MWRKAVSAILGDRGVSLIRSEAMPFREPIARERLVVGLALYAGAVAAGAAAWTHAASIWV
jgi:hypothetical protein